MAVEQRRRTGQAPPRSGREARRPRPRARSTPSASSPAPSGRANRAPPRPRPPRHRPLRRLPDRVAAADHRGLVTGRGVRGVRGGAAAGQRSRWSGVTARRRAATHSTGRRARSSIGTMLARKALRPPSPATPAPAPNPPHPPPRAVILDPFGGTGTTALVAKALGRHGISVDMSADYCRLAEWRTNDRDQLAKVLGIAKAEPVACLTCSGVSRHDRAPKRLVPATRPAPRLRLPRVRHAAAGRVAGAVRVPGASDGLSRSKQGD
jgi:hypothetical protein